MSESELLTRAMLACSHAMRALNKGKITSAMNWLRKASAAVQELERREVGVKPHKLTP